MSEATSAYLLFFREPHGDCYEGLSPEQRTDLGNQWNAWYEGLAARGKVQHGHPLHPTGRVVTGTRGGSIVDGPFAEAKEAIGGYFLLTVSGLEEATEIARQCPSLYLGMTVEVRPIADACAALGVQGRAAKTHEAVTA